MGLIPVEAKATTLSLLEAAQHGKLLEVYREKIAHGFGVDESVTVLQGQLQDAIRDGNVGDTAVLTINLRRQNAIGWEKAAASMQQANHNAVTIFENARDQEADKIHPRPSWMPNWVPPLSILFSPRRWIIEAHMADMEVAAQTAQVRENRWRRYANQLHQTSQAT